MGVVDFSSVPLLLAGIVLEPVHEDDLVAWNISQGFVRVLGVEDLFSGFRVNGVRNPVDLSLVGAVGLFAYEDLVFVLSLLGVEFTEDCICLVVLCEACDGCYGIRGEQAL